MRSGASGRSRWVCNSVSARLRVLWSLARFIRCRVNSSWALRVTVSNNAFLSPRCGTRTCTFEPRTISQPLLVGRGVVGLVRHEHLLRHADDRLLAVQRFEDAVDQQSRGELLDLVEHEPLAAHHPALAHVEHLHRRLELVLGDADHVEVLVLVGDHLLLRDRLAHRIEAVAEPGGPLELELGRRSAHLGLEPR